MAWPAIIAALLEVFGPMLQAWLKDCTEERLKDAAGSLAAPSDYGSEGAAATALFDQAIADMPRLAFVRRAALRRMKAAAVVGGKLRKTPLTAAEIAEARDLVAAVKGE